MIHNPHSHEKTNTIKQQPPHSSLLEKAAQNPLGDSRGDEYYSLAATPAATTTATATAATPAPTATPSKASSNETPKHAAAPAKTSKHSGKDSSSGGSLDFLTRFCFALSLSPLPTESYMKHMRARVQ